MIVASVDLQSGEAVQLVGGKERALSAGDPRPIATQFGTVGEVAVIDLDAALSIGSNKDTILDLLKIAPCRVGGGIRSIEQAIGWLDAGASKIILGTRAVPEILQELPAKRVIAALDAENGEVVVEGWQTKTGHGIIEKILELRDYVGGFLVTFVEREGRLGGTNLDLVAEIVAAAGKSRVTIAGGVTTAQEVAELDRLGADAQVGMAIYTGRLSLAEAFAAPLVSDRVDGLWPTVVCDEHGVALGLAWSNLESLKLAIETRRGVYFSRRRGIWEKGATSGAGQELLHAALDCDRDAIRFVVRQHGEGFCHEATRTCWGEDWGVPKLFRATAARRERAPEGSYTLRLFDEPGLLEAKLKEETEELIEADSRDAVSGEAADLLYFVAARLAQKDVDLRSVEQVIDSRSLKVTRRPGNRKS